MEKAVDRLNRLGIKVKGGKIKKADLDKALAELSKADFDYDDEFGGDSPGETDLEEGRYTLLIADPDGQDASPELSTDVEDEIREYIKEHQIPDHLVYIVDNETGKLASIKAATDQTNPQIKKIQDLVDAIHKKHPGVTKVELEKYGDGSQPEEDAPINGDEGSSGFDVLFSQDGEKIPAYDLDDAVVDLGERLYEYVLTHEDKLFELLKEKITTFTPQMN